MLKWCWLLAGAALSCSSPERRFSATENSGGVAGQSAVNGESGRAAGGNAGTDAGGGDAGSELTGGAAGSDAGGDAGMAGKSDEPTCEGCVIDSACVAANAKSPRNPCEVCDVNRSRDGYSPDIGAPCGSGATECSGQDTCDESGACRENDFGADVPCSGGLCRAGVCQLRSPFDCIVPSPPTASYPAHVFSGIGKAADAMGGAVVDGRYTPQQIFLYNSHATGVDVRTFEFRKGFVQIALRYYALDTQAAFIPEVHFAGRFTGSAGWLELDVARCDPQFDIDLAHLGYTATENGMVTLEVFADGSSIETTYLRQ